MKALSIALLALAIASSPARAVIPENWQEEQLTDHPLVGRIFKIKPSIQPVAADDLREAINGSVAIAIGEIHDNRDHHRIQARLIQALEADDITVVFEMVPERLQTVLDNPPSNMGALGEALEWEARGWYTWDIYRPIFETTQAKKATLKAGAADVQVTRRISKQGVEALTAEERAGLDLDTPLPEAEQASLMKELAGAHCGMMPESALPAMASVQRFRDAKMAAEMNAAQGKAVLIAGSGHTRRDRGVPFLMDRPVISIALVEVVDGMTTADAYGLVNDAGNPTADFVIFTPRAKRDDPCKAMREAMKNRTK